MTLAFVALWLTAATPLLPGGVASAAPNSAPSEVYGYQRAHWGMGLSEVRGLYRDAKTTPSGLDWETRIADLPATVRFDFVDDQLARVTIDFTPKFDFNRMPASPAMLLAAYERLDALLTQKYGGAKADRSTGLPDVARASEEEREVAVQRGDLWLSRDWEFAETLIDLSFAGNPTVYALNITYCSNRLQQALDQREHDSARREADLKGL